LTQPITSNIEFLRLISSGSGTFKDKEEDDDDDDGGGDDNHQTQKRQQRAGSAGACERGRERRMRSGVVRRARQTRAQGRAGGGLREAANFKIEGPIDILGLGIEVPVMFGGVFRCAYLLSQFNSGYLKPLKEPSVFMKELWIFTILTLNFFLITYLLLFVN
jgi:hypothetical protein